MKQGEWVRYCPQCSTADRTDAWEDPITAHREAGAAEWTCDSCGGDEFLVVRRSSVATDDR
jgi:hypothetical protein